MAHLLSLSPGQLFAKDFRVLKLLAEGGMGAVYVAEQLSTGKQRALKLMHPRFVADPRSRARFVQEARVAAKIESDHVVEVVSAGVDDATDVPWLAMELLRGETLADAMERRATLPAAEAHEIFRQFGHALAAAHDVGLVHRDLKPENLFLATPRRPDVAFMVKILDFGIAKFVGEASVTNSATASVGSPLWMAPEQAGASGISPATDVWPLGLLAFYMLTGRYYWVAANMEGVPLTGLLTEILIEPLVAASERAARWGCPTALPQGFDAWFAQCVVRDSTLRFNDARAAITPLLAMLSNWHDVTAATLSPASRLSADAFMTPGRVISEGSWVHAAGTPMPGATTNPNHAATRPGTDAGHGIAPTQQIQLSVPPSGPISASGYGPVAAPTAAPRGNALVIIAAVVLLAGIVAGGISIARLLAPVSDDASREQGAITDQASAVAPAPVLMTPQPTPMKSDAGVPPSSPATAAQRVARTGPATRVAPSAANARVLETPRAARQPVAQPPQAPPSVIANTQAANTAPDDQGAQPGVTATSAQIPVPAAVPAPIAPPPVTGAALPPANPARPPAASNVAMGPITVDPAIAREVRQAIAHHAQECWTAAQRETPNHPSETIRVYVPIGVIGRAYNVRYEGTRDQHLGWCITAALGRHQFTVSPTGFEVSASLTLTPD